MLSASLAFQHNTYCSWHFFLSSVRKCQQFDKSSVMSSWCFDLAFCSHRTICLKRLVLQQAKLNRGFLFFLKEAPALTVHMCQNGEVCKPSLLEPPFATRVHHIDDSKRLFLAELKLSGVLLSVWGWYGEGRDAIWTCPDWFLFILSGQNSVSRTTADLKLKLINNHSDGKHQVLEVLEEHTSPF